MCVGQPSLVPYLSLEEEKEESLLLSFLGSMVRRNIERLGELVG
jgi:hypothetical protein